MKNFKPLLSIEQINEALVGAEAAFLYMLNRDGIIDVGEVPINKCQASINQLEKFTYPIKEAFLNPHTGQKLKDAIMGIRLDAGIPKNGFESRRTFKEIRAGISNPRFVTWLNTNHKDGFKKIGQIIKKYPIIKTNPKPLLTYFFGRKNNYVKLGQYVGNALLINPTSQKIYLNYLNEKPFGAIFDFILFNRLFIPSTNYVLITKQQNHINITISPNSTYQDFKVLYPKILKLQEELSGFNKNGTHQSRDFDKNLLIEIAIIKLQEQINSKIKEAAPMLVGLDHDEDSGRRYKYEPLTIRNRERDKFIKKYYTKRPCKINKTTINWYDKKLEKAMKRLGHK